MGELHVADVRSQVALSLYNDFDEGKLAPAAHQLDALGVVLDEVVDWSVALATLRTTCPREDTS